jgi:hypothetical protein
MRIQHELDDIERHSGDGGESLTTWMDEVERNRREDEKQRIEKEWYENERSRAATADYEYQVEEDLDE